MTKIYVVQRYIAYEGTETLGIFSSLNKAINAMEEKEFHFKSTGQTQLKNVPHKWIQHNKSPYRHLKLEDKYVSKYDDEYDIVQIQINTFIS